MQETVSTFDVEQTDALVRTYFLGDFLSDCIVDNGYRPPLPLTAALSLTARGTRLAGQIKGNGVELREAQLAAFMAAWAGNELLIDLENIEIEAIRLSMSSEIRHRKIRLPWIYGRQFYDLIADLPFHGSPTPRHDETMGLLDQLPQGVFQLGPYISGPYGLIEGREWRLIPPKREVPGFHCDEIGCKRIHSIVLSTGETKASAAMNKLREKTSKFHAFDTVARAAVEEFISKRIRRFHWRSNTTLPHFLGDCITLTNLRALAAKLFDQKGGRLREECGSKLDVEISAAVEFVESIGEAELMQIVLLATDDEIHKTLNSLIWSRDIVIPRGELRHSIIEPRGKGYLGLRLEASSLGVRHVPNSQFIFVRLQSIINKAFPAGEPAAEDRLLWLLRSYDGETAAAKLHVALAIGEPGAVVERLLVADQTACATAFGELGLPMEAFKSATDADISQVLTWHLGFKAHGDQEDPTAINDAVTTLRKIIQSLAASRLERSDEERIRSVAGNLFPGLEKLLKRALGFTAWALCNDHYSISYEMRYSPGEAERYLDAWLADTPGLPKLSDGTTLAEILTCFGSLSKQLGRLGSKEADYNNYKRPTSEYPRIVRNIPDSFQFPFAHTKPFLDLDDVSRSGIMSVLHNVSSKLSTANAPEVRNGLLHAKKELPGNQQIEEACAAIQAVVSELVAYGLLPTVFALSRTDGDAYGRQRLTFISAELSEVVLIRPSAYHLAGFPPLSEPQIIVIGARLRTSGEPLRFRMRHDSDYQEMWTGFPKRAPESPRSAATSETQTSGID